MDHEVDVVEKHPVAGALALDVTGLELELLAQTLLDRLGNGDDLAVRGAMTDDEVIGEIAAAVKVENGDVFSLPVPGGIDGVSKFRGQLLSSRR